MTNFLKFRYDLAENETVLPVIYRLVKDGNKIPSGILGIEDKNKYGEVIKKHLHFHFMSEEKIETIRKRFNRSSDPEKKDSYSLCLEKDVKDQNKFFRYPLKQYENIDNFNNNNILIPSGFDIKIQHLLANEEWNKGKEILSRQRVKSDSRQTTYEKLIELIDNENIKFSSVKEIELYILDYYLKNNIPPKKAMIFDMSDGIAIKQEIISKNDYLRR